MSNAERKTNRFIFWTVNTDTAKRVLEHLNSGIYPDIQPLDLQEAKKYEVPEDTHYFIFMPNSIPQIRDFIVVSKIIYGPDAGKHIIKCTQGLRPILDDFLGPSNKFTIKW